jgi:hypothetical protein
MINHLGGLKREFHHIQTHDPSDPRPGKARYERALFLYKPMLKGKSAYIPDPSGWKYLDPSDNRDEETTIWDTNTFNELKRDLVRSATLHPMQDFHLEVEALEFADLLNRKSGVMRTTGYSLVKFCQLLEISVSAQSLYQLLSFIQDGLRELACMPPPVAEEETEMGEATMTLQRDGETKVWDAPLTARAGEIKTGIIQ